MNNLGFKAACDKVFKAGYRREGIGTLGEKTLHAVLKHYFEPDESCHEIKVGSYFADILNSEGITEIQTRQFNKLCGKLRAFLANYKVTIVYPVANSKWLLWIDQETRKTTKKRLSPKKGSAYDAFFELYKIKQFLTHPNLQLCIVYLDIEEYRLLNGWSADGKKGSWREDRIPKSINFELKINSKDDYCLLIPDALPEHFSSKDFAKASGLNVRNAQTALNVLLYVDAVERIDKKGNLIIYQRKS